MSNALFLSRILLRGFEMRNKLVLNKHASKLLEGHLDKIEADPAFREMMRNSARDIREGRVTSHEQVMRMSQALGRRKPKKHR